MYLCASAPLRFALDNENQPRRIHQVHAGRQGSGQILRTCVHCGFCTATCPTYQLLGDELDSPRGRIYLIKEVLEGNAGHRQDAIAPGPLPDLPCLRNHLSFRRGIRKAGGHRPQHRRAARAEASGRRPQARGAARRVAAPRAVQAAVQGRTVVRPLLPGCAEKENPESRTSRTSAGRSRAHARKMLVLDGCVQPTLAPGINPATARVLDRLGISLVKDRIGRLLRRRDLPSEPPGRRPRLHAPEYRCLVAACRSRRGSRRHYRQRLRHAW